MKTLVCLDDPMPVDGECVNTAWVELAPSLFAGISWEHVEQISGALLTLAAIIVVFSILKSWAQSDLNL